MADPTGQTESVNTNMSSNQQGGDIPQLEFNFDTSEADSILAGAPVNNPAVTVPQEQGTEQQTTQQQTPQLTPEQINAIRLQLQSTQQQPPQQHQQQQEQPLPTTPQIQYPETYVTANNKFKEQTGIEFGQAIDQYMQAVVGMPLKETIEVVQGMSSYINQRQQADAIDQSTKQLQTDWGNNYNGYMELARAEYNKLPETTEKEVAFKQSLNNAQGAKLLLSNALQNQQGAGTATARAAVQYNPFSAPSPASTVTNGQQPQLLYSQILQMNDAQFASPQVQEALASGPGVGYVDDVGISQYMKRPQQQYNGGLPNPQQMMLG